MVGEIKKTGEVAAKVKLLNMHGGEIFCRVKVW